MSEEKIRVLLAEDHHVVRRALRDHLQRDPSLLVVGEVAEGASLNAAVAEHQPDILLMDVEMPNHEPITAVERLRKEYPAMVVLVLSMHKTSEYVVGLFKAGASGYVLKDDPPDTLIRAIHQTTQGEQWVSPQAAVVLAAHVRNTLASAAPALTERELEVLELIARGYHNEEIAVELTISEYTVRNHISNIFQKLKVKTRVEAVVSALSQDLISLQQVTEESIANKPSS